MIQSLIIFNLASTQQFSNVTNDFFVFLFSLTKAILLNFSESAYNQIEIPVHQTTRQDLKG